MVVLVITPRDTKTSYSVGVNTPRQLCCKTQRHHTQVAQTPYQNGGPSKEPPCKKATGLDGDRGQLRSPLHDITNGVNVCRGGLVLVITQHTSCPGNSKYILNDQDQHRYDQEKKSSVSFKLNDNNLFTSIRKLCLLAKKDQQFTRCERNSRKGRKEEKKKGRRKKKREEKEKTIGKSTQRDYLVKRTYFGLRSTPTLSRPMPDVQGSLPMATRI